MDERNEYIRQAVPEDAAEGVTLIVPRPKTEWHCLRCGTRNTGIRKACAMCGQPRETVER